jgi:hypothetical protein
MTAFKMKYLCSGSSIIETVTLVSGTVIDDGIGGTMTINVPISYGITSGTTEDAPISKVYISEDPENGAGYGYTKQTSTGFYVHPMLGMTNLDAEPDPHYPDGIALINGNLYKCIDNVWIAIEEGADTVKFTTDFDADLTDWTDVDGDSCESTYQASKTLDFTINDVLQLQDGNDAGAAQRNSIDILSQNYTVFSFWMGVSDIGKYNLIYFFEGATQLGYLCLNDNAIRWANAGGEQILSTASSNTWYHITLQFSITADTVKIWINGLYNSTQTLTNNITVGIQSLRLMTEWSDTGYYGYTARPYFGNSISEAMWSYYQYKGPTSFEPANANIQAHITNDVVTTAAHALAAAIDGTDDPTDGETKGVCSDKLFHALADKISTAIGTTKGSLVGFSAASTALRIPSGTEGQVLTMLAAQTAGIGWQTLSAVLSVQTPIYPCSRAGDWAWNSTDDYLEYSLKSTGTKNCYLYPVVPSGTTNFVVYGYLGVEGINATIYLSGCVEQHNLNSMDGWNAGMSSGISFYDSDGMGNGGDYIMTLNYTSNISTTKYRIRMAYHSSNTTAAYQVDVRGMRTT